MSTKRKFTYICGLSLLAGFLAASLLSSAHAAGLGSSGNTTPTTTSIGAQPVDSDLTCAAGLATTGLINRTGTGTCATKTTPSGTVVGDSDSQTLTNKSIAGSEINSGAVSPTYGGKPSNYYSNSGNMGNYTTSSATQVMFGGVSGAWRLTPATTGNVRITFVGTTQATGANTAAIYNFNYGTGASPVQGAAVSGTSCTVQGQQSKPLVVGAIESTAYECEITGLTLSTAIWVDIAIESTITGAVLIQPLFIRIEEF